MLKVIKKLFVSIILFSLVISNVACDPFVLNAKPGVDVRWYQDFVDCGQAVKPHGWDDLKEEMHIGNTNTQEIIVKRLSMIDAYLLDLEKTQDCYLSQVKKMEKNVKKVN